MPIYLTENDSPNFRKISDIILPTGGIEGGQFASKKICKVYICTNTDPLEFKLVYNNCGVGCPCMCDWCLIDGLGSPAGFSALCTYHAKEIVPVVGSSFGDCNCSDDPDTCLYDGCYDEFGNRDPSWVFVSGCYYNSHQIIDPCGEGKLAFTTCFKKCCDNITTTCSLSNTLLDGDNCCAYVINEENTSGKSVYNPALYCNCYGEIPPDDPNGFTCP